jgi:hypothetical protein
MRWNYQQAQCHKANGRSQNEAETAHYSQFNQFSNYSIIINK